MPRKFWQFRNSAEAGYELLLYGDISQRSWWGDEATPRQFAEDLNAIGDVDELTVRINSGGGDVFAATAIGNMLESCGARVTAVIDGLCASAATIVACHCSRVVAAADATYMIHPVRMGVFDYVDSETMRTCMEALETIRDNIVSLYAKKTGREKDEVAALMDATSWWTAAQAKDNGFIDELKDDETEPVVENRDGILFVNSISMNMPFDKAPSFVQNSIAAAPAANCLGNRNPAEGQPVATITQEVQEMEFNTIDELREAYPELVAQLEQAAANRATEAERERIREIMDMSMDGSEAIAHDAMFTNPISADAFARAALKNAKAQNAANLAGMQRDAQASGVNNVAQAAEGGNSDEFLNAIRSVNNR